MTALAATVAIVTYAVLPRLVSSHLRDTLVARGFPDARLEVASIGMRHVDLRNVHLADGFDIGSLHLDRGLSLLWSRPHGVAIDGATVTTKALAETSRKLRGQGRGIVPFDHAVITDSTLTTGSTHTQLTASAARAGSTLDIAVTLRDPTENGWTASAQARVIVGKTVALDRGHVDITLPSRQAGRVSVTSAELSADLSGDLSSLQLAGSGRLTGQRVDIGGYALTDAEVPFTLDRAGLHVWGAHAATCGGELAVDPFVVRGEPLDLVVRARGLELGRLLAKTERVHGTGRIDGQLAVHVGGDGWALTSAELHARDRGTIQIADAAWRDQISRAESPFAIHAQVANALTDLELTTFSVALTPSGDDQELRVVARGHGRRNHQELDLAVAVHGVRALTHRLPGALP